MDLSTQVVDQWTASLSGYVSGPKEALLPLILLEWARVDLEVHLNEPTPEQVRAERQHLEKLARQATEFAETVSALSPTARFMMAGCRLEAFAPIEPGSAVYVPKPNVKYAQIREAEHCLGEEPARLRKLAMAATEASATWQPLSMRHNTTIRYLILQDLTAIFEYATGEKASRKVRVDPHPDAGREYGVFWDFTSAVWRTVFGSTRGLGYAMQSWTEARAEYSEQSPVIGNIGLRHPEWRVFEH
jgi:hypothetical protein